MNTSSNADPVGILTRLDFDTVAPHFSRALGTLDAAATRELDAAGIDPLLRELVRIRASQINGCSYCVDMHTTDASAKGEHQRRLAAVAVWRESSLFTERERAALSLAESMTRLSETHVPEEAWATAATVFTPEELGALVALNVVINAWNGVGVSTRAWTVTL
ncbi:MAG: carboxymuconolactone decarboxylase family protein [Microbacterium sp.]|uniref:carboxymuconolactone decarboxylase family protein n=1 Tax=Microbacterium gubbeenense TaxID=159896 RepID=UPI003F9C4E92